MSTLVYVVCAEALTRYKYVARIIRGSVYQCDAFNVRVKVPAGLRVIHQIAFKWPGWFRAVAPETVGLFSNEYDAILVVYHATFNLAAGASAEGTNKFGGKSTSGGRGQEELEVEGSFGVYKEILETGNRRAVDARAIDCEVVDGSLLDTPGDGYESTGGCNLKEARVLF